MLPGRILHNYLSVYSIVLEDDFSAADSIADDAWQDFSKEGRIGRAGRKRLLDCPGCLWVEDHQVGRGALQDPACGQMIKVRRIAGQAGQKLYHGQMAGLHKLTQSQGKCGLEADHSTGGTGKALCLFFVRVRRVVGRDQVERTVL